MVEPVLVTGAAGFIGRHVVRACLAEDIPVVAVDRRSPPRDIAARTEFHTGSFDDRPVLDDVGRGRFRAVLHLGAISSTLEQDWSALRRANVDGPLQLARRCADSGTRLVYASSFSVYGHIAERVPVPESALGSPLCSGPLNLYAESKALFDEELAGLPAGDDGPGWAGLRFTNVFGTGERHKATMACILSQFVRRAARGKPITVFADTLDACRDYVPVAAVAETVLRMADPGRGSGVFNLGSGIGVSFAQLLGWCAEFAGAPLRVDLVPNPHLGRYQFWTCADLRALDAVLPERPRTDLGDLHAAAQALFERQRRR